MANHTHTWWYNVPPLRVAWCSQQDSSPPESVISGDASPSVERRKPLLSGAASSTGLWGAHRRTPGSCMVGEDWRRLFKHIEAGFELFEIRGMAYPLLITMDILLWAVEKTHWNVFQVCAITCIAIVREHNWETASLIWTNDTHGPEKQQGLYWLVLLVQTTWSVLVLMLLVFRGTHVLSVYCHLFHSTVLSSTVDDWLDNNMLMFIYDFLCFNMGENIIPGRIPVTPASLIWASLMRRPLLCVLWRILLVSLIISLQERLWCVAHDKLPLISLMALPWWLPNGQPPCGCDL